MDPHLNVNAQYEAIKALAKESVAVSRRLRAKRSKKRKRTLGKRRLPTQFEEDVDALHLLDFGLDQDAKPRPPRTTRTSSSSRVASESGYSSGLLDELKGVPEREETEVDEEGESDFALSSEDEDRLNTPTSSSSLMSEETREWTDAGVLRAAMTGQNLLGMLEEKKRKFNDPDGSNNGYSTLDLFIDLSSDGLAPTSERHPALPQVAKTIEKGKKDRGGG